MNFFLLLGWTRRSSNFPHLTDIPCKYRISLRRWYKQERGEEIIREQKIQFSSTKKYFTFRVSQLLLSRCVMKFWAVSDFECDSARIFDITQLELFREEIWTFCIKWSWFEGNAGEAVSVITDRYFNSLLTRSMMPLAGNDSRYRVPNAEPRRTFWITDFSNDSNNWENVTTLWLTSRFR